MKKARTGGAMQARKPKFSGIRTKWEKKRAIKGLKRRAHGKKPGAGLLTIAPAGETNAALKKGRLVFYDGGKRIELPLAKKGLAPSEALQGVFKMPKGEIIAMRSSTNPSVKSIRFYRVEAHRELHVTNTMDVARMADQAFVYTSPAFAFRHPDLGHLLLPKELRGQLLGLKTASKTEREQRALHGGTHSFETTVFGKLYRKLGYKGGGRRGVPQSFLRKTGKFQPKDNMDEYHRIEAIDPKTGKARIFTFRIAPAKKT